MVVKREFYVGYSDVDERLKIKNNAILSLFEDMAIMHATQVGDGVKTSNGAWLLTGYKVNVIKRPEHEEDIEVYTWGREMKGVMATREFEIRNREGELLVAAISNWAHISLETRKLDRVTPEIIKKYEIENERTNFNEVKLEKLAEPESYLSERSFKIDYNWIDSNCHMNNVYYLEAAEMTLPEEIRNNIKNSNFEIMYKKEIKYKEIIKCLYSETENEYVVTIKSEDLSKLHAVIKWDKN